MANTYQPSSAATVLLGGTTGDIYVHLHVISDGTEMTNYVFYDNSALAANVLKGSLKEVWVSGVFTGPIRLNWDRTTPFKIATLSQNNNYYDFSKYGGIRNPGGTGATGDLTITTTTLASGDEFHIIARIGQ